MGSLVDVYKDILEQSREKLPGFVTINVWNNQTTYERDGQYVGYAKPALFIEVVKNQDIGALPEGVSASDVAVIFHVVDDFSNDEGNFEQNLRVFYLVKDVEAAFTKYKAPGMSPMVLFNEVQDQTHTQIYEYLVGFVAHFIDTNGYKEGTEATLPDAQITAVFVEPKNYIIPT